jgi:hypothetical protein
MGTGQMIRGTLLENLRQLGIPESEWGNLKFDKNLQERLTLMNFKSSGIGDPNADPSTWNMRRLGQQYESIDTTKGFAAMSAAETQVIASASPTKPLPGPVTAESVAQKRRQLEEQERQAQQTFLAEKTIPKLPEGLDPRIAKDIEKFSPARKQDVMAMLEKAGGGDISKGVSKLNETYKQNPTYVTESISRGNNQLVPEKPVQTATPAPEQPKAEPAPIQQAQADASQMIGVFAEGGSQAVNTDEIKAMPIESLKGDNSVVVDKTNNPLFTMNTKEEQASYNPMTRQVDVQPVTKTDPNRLGEKPTSQDMSATKNMTDDEYRPQPPTMPSSMMSSRDSSIDVSASITNDIFKDPSFKRAIGKTRFVDTGDGALGGHFGQANADI